MIMQLTTHIATAGLPKTYWTDSKMALFWDYVKWFLTFNMKWIMIIGAIAIVGMLIAVIMYIPVHARKAQEGEEDNDFEIHYYK